MESEKPAFTPLEACMFEALQEAKKLADLAADLTGCRGDDEYVWNVQKQIDAALSKALGKDAP